MEPNGIFDKVVWNNICKYVIDYPTWIALSTCCKTTFNATRHGGGGNVRWKIESVSVLHELLKAEYKSSISAVNVPDFTVYTALCLTGLVIDSLTVTISNNVFECLKDSFYQGGNMLKEFIVKRKLPKDVVVGEGLYFFYLPPNLRKLEINLPEHVRFGQDIWMNVVFHDTLRELNLFCSPINYVNDNGGNLKTLPDFITAFRFKDKRAFECCPVIPIGIEKLIICGEDSPKETNRIFEHELIYPKLKYLHMLNTLPSKDVTVNRLIRTSQFPNIVQLQTHNVRLKNDAKLPFRAALTMLNDNTRYKFNKDGQTQQKRLRIK